MYTPRSFQQQDPAVIRRLVAEYPFATLFTSSDGVPSASHLPLFVRWDEGTEGVIYGHMARANRQWNGVAGSALAVFQGPHAYISARWYREPHTVPTWNYVAVHLTGPFVPIDDEGEASRLLAWMAVQMEPAEDGWRMDMEDDRLLRMTAEIVPFRIPIECIEAKWKLSQNHEPARRQRVMDALEASTNPLDREVARLMQEFPGSR